MKIIRNMLVLAIFVTSFFYFFGFVQKINPDDPYERTLQIGDHSTENGPYTRLETIMEGKAMIHVESSGPYLVVEGQRIDVGKQENFLLPPMIEGEIHVKDVGKGSMTIFADVDRTGTFYFVNSIIVTIISGLLTYLSFLVVLGIVFTLKHTVSSSKKRKRNKRKKDFKVI